jgi:SH3-like domain-containing protein
MNRSSASRSLLLGLSLLTAAVPALALDYRSVEPGEGAAAIMYDAPSKQGKKLFLIRRYTPVEVVVSLEGWAKVRDVDGGMAWVERKALSERRTVVVTAASATVRGKPEDTAPSVFEADKSVALELLEPASAGWAKVKHRDGGIGYIRANQVWGL